MAKILVDSVFRCGLCKGILDIESILDSDAFKSAYGRHISNKVKQHKGGTGRPRKGETIEEYRDRIKNKETKT